MTMRMIWLPALALLASIALACDGGGGGVGRAEDLPRLYHRAIANEDWEKAWGMFSAGAREDCSYETFVSSRESFREQTGDQYDYWQGVFQELSEGEWLTEVSDDTAAFRLPSRSWTLDAVREDGAWYVDRSGEYDSCRAFGP